MRTWGSQAVFLTLASAISSACGPQAPPEIALNPARIFAAEPFSSVRGVQELRSGQVLVVDQRESAVFLVDFDAQVRSRLGRRGNGPQEYESPVALYPFRGDSVVLVGLGNGRLEIAGVDGRIGRTEPLFAPGVSIPEAVDSAGNRYWDGVVHLRTLKRSNPSLDQAPIIRFDPGAGAIDTLAYLTIPGAPGPDAFPAWDEWAVGLDGRVAIVRNQDDYRLDWIERDGTIRRGVSVRPLRLLRVSRDDQQAVNQNRAVTRGGSVRLGNTPSGRAPTTPEIPGRFPPARLGGVWVTHDGRALVVRHQHLAERRPLVDVFDNLGTRIGSLRLPPDRQLVGTGPSGLYAARVDDVGFFWLELYVLPAFHTGD